MIIFWNLCLVMKETSRINRFYFCPEPLLRQAFQVWTRRSPLGPARLLVSLRPHGGDTSKPQGWVSKSTNREVPAPCTKVGSVCHWLSLALVRGRFSVHLLVMFFLWPRRGVAQWTVGSIHAPLAWSSWFTLLLPAALSPVPRFEFWSA